jgi:hypothetical protein
LRSPGDGPDLPRTSERSSPWCAAARNRRPGHATLWAILSLVWSNSLLRLTSSDSHGRGREMTRCAARATRQSRQELAQLPRPAKEYARGCWVGWDQAGRILRDFLRVGSLESKRAERPNVL